MLVNMSNASELRILYWNADGIHKKQQELLDLAVSDLNVDIIALNETRLTGRLTLKIPGFSCYRIDQHPNGSGQGVAILVRADIDHSVVASPPTHNLEAIGISLPLKDGNITLYSVYQSPNRTLLASDISALMASGNKLLIMGDLNAKYPYWSPGPINQHGTTLYELMVNDEFIIHAPNDPTLVHYRGELKPSIPDILLSKNIYTIEDIKTIYALSSNHLPVLVRLATKLHRKPIRKLNYAKANWNDYRSFLNDNITISQQCYKSVDELDSAISHLQNTIISARDISIPTTTLKPWESSLPRCIKRKIKHKNQLRRYFAKETDSAIRNTLNCEVKKLKLNINSALKTHQDEQWNRKLKRVDNPSSDLWRLAKGLKSTSTFTIPVLKASDGTKISKPKEQCDLLASTFSDNMLLTHNWNSDEQTTVNTSMSSLEVLAPNQLLIPLVRPAEIKNCINSLKLRKSPGADQITNYLIKNLPRKCIVLLTKVFNACFLLSYFPKLWKTARVIAIHKPGKDPTDPAGYRPISLLPCLGKLFEKIIFNRLRRASSNILIDEQFGFRQAHSTTQQLARVAETILQGLNMHESTGMFLLDIEKAFDTVWHQGLIHKLIQLDTPSVLIHLIKSYLNNRSFQVHIGDFSSTPKFVPAGVPQGSILGPQLFLIYLNDIPKQTRTSLACFADDTASFTSSKDVDLVIGRLQLSLDLLSSYFQKWKLKINASKTEAIMFTRQRKPPVRTLKIEGYAIPWSPSVKYLGTVLDNKLNWSANTLKLRLKGTKALNTLSPILNRSSCLSSRTKLNIYKTLVRPCITYACPVWSSTCLTNMNKLQVIQNKALKYAYNTPFRTNLHKLHVQINFPTLYEFIYKLSKKFYLHSNQKIKNKLVKNICKTRMKNLVYIDKYNRYKLPHHLFLECDE